MTPNELTQIKDAIQASIKSALLEHKIECPVFKSNIPPDAHEEQHMWVRNKMKFTDKLMNTMVVAIFSSIVAWVIARWK